jgi:hypothetical protein
MSVLIPAGASHSLKSVITMENRIGQPFCLLEWYALISKRRVHNLQVHKRKPQDPVSGNLDRQQ